MTKLLPRISLSIFILFTLCFSMDAQVNPDINSGNPSFPFPQFLPYAHPDGNQLGNLADHNPEGVSHAEMEQRVRDGWKIMCNNIVQVPDAIVGGVQYLASNAPMDCNCAEGYGYYLLAAAYMADKTVYDGLYMYIHDNSFNGVTRFIDGVENIYKGYNRGLSYAGSFGDGEGLNPYGGGIGGGNSAADGDHDIALATLIAYKQWGENSGVITSTGKELNYKEEALNYIRAMADTGIYAPSLPIRKFYSGVIGFDGYIKGGDTWEELTPFALNGYKGIQPERASAGKQHFDYYAPGYYRQFSDFLNAQGENPWLINQYKRGEASSDWLMGELYKQGPQKIPFAGWVELTSDSVKFSSFSGGEDFRAPWRTILNYTWHGNPSETWDPATHEVIPGTSNSFEKDMAVRLASFMKNQQGAPWNNACVDYGTVPLTFKGPSTIYQNYTPDGLVTDNFPLNWAQGTCSPAAVAAQDFELMGMMFRQCVIEWDADDAGYLTSHPKYFHEWFRMLGMLMLTGNHHAPSNMTPTANLKIYHSIDKTMAFNNDVLTFKIDYRNYGSLDATGSKISLDIPSGLSFVSASLSPTIAGNKVIFDLGTIPGFKTGKLDATKGQITMVVKLAADASGTYCVTPSITCNNGSGWTSNEYPNNNTSTMERNCVDVVKRALKISKSANRALFNPGDTLTYSIDFTNSSEAGWLDGGRPGVNFAFAHGGILDPANSNSTWFKFRIFNDAAEPYIDYGNYRFSYFLNEPTIKCLATDSNCTNGWGLSNTIYEGGDVKGVTFFREAIVPGTDSQGSWNQRIAIKFAPQLATTSQHLLNYSGLPNRVKEGGLSLLRGVWRFYTSNHSNVAWNDDWSWDSTASDVDGGLYYPITPDWTNPKVQGVEVNGWHRQSCQTANKKVSNVLVEEWDGYVWRRIFGNGPIPGRDIENVIITDTLPQGVSFAGFTGADPFGIAPEFDPATKVVSWKIPKLLISQKGKITYRAKVNLPSGKNCPTANEPVISKAWIQGASESPFPDFDTIQVTCTKVIVCNASSTFKIITDKNQYNETDSVVSYTIQYNQVEGSIGKSSLSSIADWTIQSGSGVSIADGALTSSNGSNFIITHNYSHGTNTLGEGFQGTFEMVSYSRFGLVVRYDPVAKTGTYIIFRPNFSYTDIEIYNNNALLTKGTIPVVIPNMDYKIELKGDQLNLWLGKAPFDVTPMYTAKGLIVQPGYAGVVHGTIVDENINAHKITYWNAHFDSGFDLSISNIIPKGTSQPRSISDGGVLSDSIISWSLSPPSVPVIFNSAFDVSYTITIDNCSEGIVNNSFVQLKGHPLNLFQTCHLIQCSSVGPADSIVLKAENDNVNLAAILSWTTTSNGEAKEYVLSKSKGGGAWALLTIVPASASSTYTFTDKNPMPGISYYQVKQINKDGTSLSSTIVTFGYNGSLAFKVDNIDGSAVLTWLSSYELNTAKYEVERSSDGNTWESIYSTDAKGPNKIYNYTDKTPLFNKSFYRIKQVFNDETSIASVVISFVGPVGVEDGSFMVKNIWIYPNPASTELNIHYNHVANITYSIKIISAIGTVVYSQEHLRSGEVSTIAIAENLPSGSFILVITSDQHISHHPFVKR